MMKDYAFSSDISHPLKVAQASEPAVSPTSSRQGVRPRPGLRRLETCDTAGSEACATGLAYAPHTRSRNIRVRNPSSRSLVTAAAFTLVEILVALGIFSMVLVAIFSTWTSILRAAKVGTEAAAAVQRARMAGRTLEEALGSTMLFVANRPYYTFLSENGSEGYLEFTTHLSPSFPRSGKFGGLDVRRIRFSIQQRDGDRQFVLQQWPYLMDMDKDEQNFPLVLAKHVREFKSEFWDTKTQDWIDEWTKTNELPVMVRVTLKIAENEISTRVQQQVCRIVSLPSIGVSPVWQTAGAAPPGGPAFPGAPGNPANPGANPVNPGNPAFPNNPGFPGNPSFRNPGGYPNYPRQ